MASPSCLHSHLTDEFSGDQDTATQLIDQEGSGGSAHLEILPFLRALR